MRITVTKVLRKMLIWATLNLYEVFFFQKCIILQATHSREVVAYGKVRDKAMRALSGTGRPSLAARCGTALSLEYVPHPRQQRKRSTEHTPGNQHLYNNHQVPRG